LARRRAREAEREEAAGRAQEARALRQAGAAERVEDDVDALALRQLLHLGLEVDLVVIDAVGNTYALEIFVLRRRRRSEDLGALCLAHLDRGDSDSTSGGMDQNTVILTHGREIMDHVIRGDIVDREGGPLLVAHAVGDPARRRRVRAAEVAVA